MAHWQYDENTPLSAHTVSLIQGERNAEGFNELIRGIKITRHVTKRKGKWKSGRCMGRYLESCIEKW
jgi:hypothetical protein